MPKAPDTFENQERRRNKQRLVQPTATQAEKALLRAEVAEEIEEAKKLHPKKRSHKSRDPIQARASVWKSLWQQNSPRKVRTYLLKFAPEMGTPRLLLQLNVIVEEALLLRDLMHAHREQRDIHTEMGAALLKLTITVDTLIQNLPPLPPDGTEIVTYLQSIEEILTRLDKLYTKFLAASPFLYVEKIQNVIAKLLALLREAGLTTKGARIMQIDLEEELRQFEGLVAAEVADAPDEDNPAVRARLMKEQRERDHLTRGDADPVDAGDEELEIDPLGDDGEEEEDE